MDWYIIRHADKEEGEFYNPALRHQDQPISSQGQVEARSLVPFFAKKTIARVFISEYIRTGQTISYVAEHLQLTPVVDRRLNEIDNGVIDGMSGSEVRKAFPETWQRFQARDQDFRFPKGETGAEAQTRINSFFEEQFGTGDNLLLVTHDGWIRLLMCTLLDIPVFRRWDFRVDTSGIMEIKYLPAYERWQIIRFNHICQDFDTA
jgi:broad specificity phosphatase PhoE